MGGQEGVNTLGFGHPVETSVVIVLTLVVGKQVHPARRMALAHVTPHQNTNIGERTNTYGIN